MSTHYHYSINATGIAEIADFLRREHRLGRSRSFTLPELRLWAEDAESRLDSGRPATIELESYEARRGLAVSYPISSAGIDATEVEVRGDI